MKTPQVTKPCKPATASRLQRKIPPNHPEQNACGWTKSFSHHFEPSGRHCSLVLPAKSAFRHHWVSSFRWCEPGFLFSFFPRPLQPTPRVCVCLSGKKEEETPTSSPRSSLRLVRLVRRGAVPGPRLSRGHLPAGGAELQGPGGHWGASGGIGGAGERGSGGVGGGVPWTPYPSSWRRSRCCHQPKKAIA